MRRSTLTDHILKLTRAGADASRAKVSDGRTYNTFEIKGFGVRHLLLAGVVGATSTVSVAALAVVGLGYSIATPSDQKILLVVRAAQAERQIIQMTGGDLSARVVFDPATAAALSDALKSGSGTFLYSIGRYLAQLPTEEDRERAVQRILALIARGAENASLVDEAIKWSEFATEHPGDARNAIELAERQGRDPSKIDAALTVARVVGNDAHALAVMAETEPDALKAISALNRDQLRALTKLATAIARPVAGESTARLDAAVAWLRDGRPLPKCDAVAPTCSVEETMYGVTCGIGMYVSIQPVCAYCPGAGLPERDSNGIVRCIYKNRR